VERKLDVFVRFDLAAVWVWTWQCCAEKLVSLVNETSFELRKLLRVALSSKGRPILANQLHGNIGGKSVSLWRL